ncbi:MAG: hypothetical protein ACRELY_03860 [Polyangiaceae bacterium]
MRLHKILASVTAIAAVALATVTLSTPSNAGGDESLLQLTCTGGNVTVKAVAPWHTNPAAPWKWTDGTKVSVSEGGAIFKGAACKGTVSAFICEGTEKCKGPIKVEVK